MSYVKDFNLSFQEKKRAKKDAEVNFDFFRSKEKLATQLCF